MPPKAKIILEIINQWESLDKEAFIEEMMQDLLTDEQVDRILEAVTLNLPLKDTK